MRNGFEMFVWLGFFAAVFFAWYFYLKARNKERMALIESGKDVSEIYSKQEIKFRFPWLKIGMLATGIGFGMSIVMLLALLTPAYDEIVGETDFGEMLMAACMILFGGLGLVLGYYLEKRKK